MLNGPSSTDEIKARLGVVEVVGTYVKLEKSGSHWKARCPFHNERTPSFMVNEERGMWHCFGCNRGGDIFAFVMEIEGLEFREALRLLADKAGVELPQYRGGGAEERQGKDRLATAMDLAVRFFEKQLWDGEGKKRALPYLRQRGLSDDSIRAFRLGYALPGWRHLGDFLERQGYTLAEAEAAGLSIRKENGRGPESHYDRFRDRIMFPVFDILGRPIGFSARVAPGGDESQAKYINTPETALYHKSRALYGLSQAKAAMKAAGFTVVVEGNMDVIAMHQAGLENTVAVSGTALTLEQLSLMKRYGREVRLFFDMDGAGQKAARKSAELALSQELQVSLVALSSGKDAADLARDDASALVAAAEHPVPAPEYFLNALLAAHDIRTPEGKRAVTEDFLGLLSHMENPIERGHWLKELGRRVGVDEKVLAGLLGSALRSRNASQEGEASSPRAALSIPQNRAERLREEIIAILFADEGVRQGLFPKLDPEVRSYLSDHPLFFFLNQAQGGDPVSLIEAPELKAEAARLSFRVLEDPELASLPDDARRERLESLAAGYLSDLSHELNASVRLRSIETALRAARERGDKEEEQRLLREFADRTRGTLPAAS